VRPSELAHGLRAGGLQVNAVSGLGYDVLGDAWKLNDDLDVNYLMLAYRDRIAR
jgi:2-polyprenyl-6-hydroxyphenyl methylase/3-demethylubiquinone-9 3-methyltransferase